MPGMPPSPPIMPFICFMNFCAHPDPTSEKRCATTGGEAFVAKAIVFGDVPPGGEPLPMLDTEPSAVQEVGAF